MKTLQILTFTTLLLFLGMQVNAQPDNSSDEVSIEKLQEAYRLTDIVSEKKINGTIHSFTVSIKKGGDILIYSNDGNLFSEELLNALDEVSSNDHIWIDDIKITRIQQINMSASLSVKD